MTTTPASLLEQLRGPVDQAAWTRFVRLYTPLLWAWARRLGLDPADAADLVQDVFVVLVKKLPDFRYDRDKSFRAWLRTVAVNRWRDLRRRRPLPTAPAGAVVDQAAADDGDFLDEYEYRRRLAARALQLVRGDFEPATWKAFWECTVAGRPVAAVATELGLTANAVYLAKGRVLRRLREELDGLVD